MRNLLINVILVVCIFSFLPNIACADIKDGLISVWSLDEGEGTYTEDQAGENHGLLLQGSTSSALPTWVTPGKLDNSHLLFTSGTTWSGPEPHSVLLNSDQTYDSHDIPTDLMPTTAVSVSAWVKADEFVYYAPVIYNSMWTGTTQSGYMMHTYNGLFNWWLKPDGGNYGIVTYAGNTDQWYHLVGTFDSTLDKDQLKFYVDGVLVGKVRCSGLIDWDPIPYNCLIGAYNDDNENHEFLGEIDDVGVWDRALTEPEIQWIYNNGIGNAIPGQPLVPTPANRAELVDWNQDLSWELVWEDLTVLGYDVYFGTDSNEISPNWYGYNKVVDNDLVNTHEPGIMVPKTTYYWRVDIIEPNDVGITTRVGKMWQFSTCPDEVVITQQPQGQVVQIGGAAQLTVEALNTNSYQWYREPTEIIVDGTDITGAQTPTLTITDFQLADEGYYFCYLEYDDSDPEKDKESDRAALMAAKLVGYWPMDGDTLDYSGNGNDGMIDDPNFVPGLVGSGALTLDGAEYVVIDAVVDDIPSNDVTMSGWVKTTDAYADWLSCNTADYGNVAIFEIWDGYADLYESAIEARSTTYVSDGEWHLLTYTRIGATGSTYVDGTLEATHTANFNLSADDRWSIGQEWDWDGEAEVGVPSDFLTGDVDDVRIYNYGMDAYEVAALFLNVKPDDYVCIGQELEMDLDGNCKVEIDDFVSVAAVWLECNLVPTCLP